jgi:predicted DNA-binding protein
LHYSGETQEDRMDDQITLRIPRELARLLARRAKERAVPKSQLVREALRGYLSSGTGEATPTHVRERIARYRGILELDAAAIEADALARQIREHNWRE